MMVLQQDQEASAKMDGSEYCQAISFVSGELYLEAQGTDLLLAAGLIPT